jgi:asparagine synthase (glutamine-hydrolysing)
MCGIAGIWMADADARVDATLLGRMIGSLAHRGPDGEGVHVEPGVGLAHRRLSIIDLAGGRQPLGNEDDSVIVTFNGEIYNFRALAQELTQLGHRFRTHSDTEVIVHAWEEWGEQSVERFVGMFAFAVWDRNRRTLFLARDRLGKKPLYYTWLPDGSFAFGSELKALLRLPQLKREIDPLAVEEYFALGYVADPRSILRGVSKLPAAHTLIVTRDGRRHAPREYWDLPAFAGRATDESATALELIDRLRDAVACRLISEVPLGAFLSGGVDSSAVVAMMAEHTGEPVNTCSISFSDPQFDETQYAARVADRYATRHNVDVVDADDFDLLDTLAQVYDEPFADSSALPTYRVCQLARRHVTVALSGDGGDEVFAGYRRYRWHMLEERVRSRMPLAMRRPLFGVLGSVYPKADWAPRVLRAKSTFQSLALETVDAYFNTMSFVPDRLRGSLLSAGLRSELQGYRAVDVLRRHATRAEGFDPLSLVQYIDFKTYLCGDILTKVDRASMAHSLEVRVPMLDHRFIEWSTGVAPGLKLRNGHGKHIFKKALEPWLPNDVLYRQKMGFAVPLANWFRGPLRQRVRGLIDGRLAASGLVDPEVVRTIVEQHERGSRDHGTPIWSLLMFDAFLRNVMESSAATVPSASARAA